MWLWPLTVKNNSQNDRLIVTLYNLKFPDGIQMQTIHKSFNYEKEMWANKLWVKMNIVENEYCYMYLEVFSSK